MNAGLTGHVSSSEIGVHSGKSAEGPVYWDDRPTLYETYTRMRVTDYQLRGASRDPLPEVPPPLTRGPNADGG